MNTIRPYDWDFEGDFHPASLLAAREMDDGTIRKAHATLVGEMLEAEMEAQATVEKLREIEALFDRALGQGRN
jgi:hypothetical protein